MKKKYKIIISWLLVIIWMFVIYYFSNMNGDASSNASNGTIYFIINFIDNLFNLNIDVENVTEILNGPIRKLAHFTVYFILSIFILIALSNHKIKLSKKIIITTLICFIYACTDEIHQLMVADRSGKFLDVLIDTSGCLLNMIIYYFRKRKIS